MRKIVILLYLVFILVLQTSCAKENNNPVDELKQVDKITKQIDKKYYEIEKILKESCMQTTTGRNPEGFCNTIKKKKRLVSDSLNTYDELIKKYKETIHYYQTISLYSDEADRLKKEIEISKERIQTLKKWRKYEAIPCWLYLNKQQEKVCKNKK